MIRFGPSGNSEEFYAAGYKHTYEAMEWLQGMGLSAYEYSFGRGVRVGESSARVIAERAKQCDIAMSVHAPYYINLASDDAEKFEKNLQYFRESAEAAKWLGAKRVIFHPGSCAKLDRTQAFVWTRDNLSRILQMLDAEGHGDLIYCPETMGKVNQIGTLEEIIALCSIDERLLPAIDFGHLHARDRGAITQPAHFDAILAALENGIGHERTARMHVHFSKIEFTNSGEKQHRTFADAGFGPDFSHLAPLLIRRRLEPVIICESKGTMAMDALAMLRMYEEAEVQQ